MDLFSILYLSPFFIYLYWIFFFVKDDFTLLRKNVSADQLFSLSIIGIFVLFFFARLGFVILNPKIIYANPLVFLAFPYYPGFSRAFGIIGIYLHIVFYTKKKKLPFLRIFDIVVAALGQAIWITAFLDFLKEMIRLHGPKPVEYRFLISGFIFLLWSLAISYMYTANKLRDGSIGYIGLAGNAFIFVCSDAIANIFFLHKSVFSAENIIMCLLFVVFTMMFVKNERFYKSKVKS